MAPILRRGVAGGEARGPRPGRALSGPEASSQGQPPRGHPPSRDPPTRHVPRTCPRWPTRATRPHTRRPHQTVHPLRAHARVHAPLLTHSRVRTHAHTHRQTHTAANTRTLARHTQTQARPHGDPRVRGLARPARVASCPAAAKPAGQRDRSRQRHGFPPGPFGAAWRAAPLGPLLTRACSLSTLARCGGHGRRAPGRPREDGLPVLGCAELGPVRGRSAVQRGPPADGWARR